MTPNAPNIPGSPLPDFDIRHLWKQKDIDPAELKERRRTSARLAKLLRSGDPLNFEELRDEQVQLLDEPESSED